MIEFISGDIDILTPTYVIIETHGIGYHINISLISYSQLEALKHVNLYIYEVIREDSHTLFGFFQPLERELFLLLISVNGVGANTARLIQSKFDAQELQNIIASGNANAIQSVKGIGTKTAQRLILDLQEKVTKLGGYNPSNASLSALQEETNEVEQEAVQALVMLGFQQAASKKTVHKLCLDTPNLTVEQMIKLSLKQL